MEVNVNTLNFNGLTYPAVLLSLRAPYIPVRLICGQILKIDHLMTVRVIIWVPSSAGNTLK